MKILSFLTARAGWEGAAREAERRAALGVHYEELLDHVWRCEREWRFDDRIAYACRTTRVNTA